MDTTQDKNTFGYQWVRKSTGEFYRGIHTGSVEDKYAGSGTIFMRKFGGKNKSECKNPDDWVRSVLFIGTREECLLWETLVVTERTLEDPSCLNVLVGGTAGRLGAKASAETRAKISKGNSGKKRSEEHIKALKESRLGKPISDEHRARIAEANRNRVWSEESRRKASEARKAYLLKKKQATMEGEVDVKQ